MTSQTSLFNQLIVSTKLILVATSRAQEARKLMPDLNRVNGHKWIAYESFDCK